MQKRGIKSFCFNHIKISDSEISGFSEGIANSGITELHLQNCALNQLSAKFWIHLANLLKENNILSLDLHHNNIILTQLEAWVEFCNLIVTSQIKTLYVDINDYHQLLVDKLTLFCDAIRQSKLETLVLDFNRTLSIMKFDNFSMLFEAINRSGIICLPYPSHLIAEIPQQSKREVILNTLRIVENRAKYQNTLVGLCASTLFGRYNAKLTDTGITYENEKNSWEHENLLDLEMNILRQFT